MKVAYYVWVYFDMDFPQLPDDELWLFERRAFFENYTLKSLLNQSFQNFRIMVLCGRKFKHITSQWNWNDKVDAVYDNGRAINKRLDTDYLVLTRLDSDDLYHREAMADVKNNTIFNNKRECLIFRHGWNWDKGNNILTPRFRQSPPFYTHIYPRGIYKDWPQFSRDHFIGHGRAGGRMPETIELPKDRHVVIKHNSNVGLRNKGLSQPTLNESQLKKLKETYPDGIFNKDQVVSKLKEYGISMEQLQ